jgi:predicted  nucleic acid-binding Zn-ribbon protein
MPLIIVGTEKNVAALRPRLYSGRVSNSPHKETTEALAAANPHVDLEKLQPGAILTVPDLPHVSVKGDVSLDDSTKELLEGLANAGASALEDLVATARNTQSAAAAERKELAKTLASKDVDAAVRKDKTLGAEVKAAQDAVDEEEKRAKERAAALDEARSDWDKELKALKSLLP